MQEKSEYLYDFSYSIAFDQPQNQPTSQMVGLDKEFMEWMEIFISMHVIDDPDIHRSTSFLFKIPSFNKLGLQLLTLCRIVYEFEELIQNKDHQLQKCRQNIYSILQEFDTVLGSEKPKYMMIIILCLYALIEKSVQKYSKMNDQFQIFHLIFWQIKGQLTNKQTMQSLIKKYFDTKQYLKFMNWTKDELMNKYLQPKRTTNTNNDHLTFRTSNVNMHKNNKTPVVYQSFKDISMLYKTMNAENQVQNYQKSYEKPTLNFNTFKKKGECKFQNFAEKPLYVGENKDLKENSRNYANKAQSPRMTLGPNNPVSFRPTKLGQFQVQYQNYN